MSIISKFLKNIVLFWTNRYNLIIMTTKEKIMARPQEFDTEVVLNKAMHEFWSKGYNATSLSNILKATGLSKSSLYATFGDKHQLFLAAFKMYQRNRLIHLKRILFTGEPFRRTLESFFRQVLEFEIGDGTQNSGCMTSNEAVELASRDIDVQKAVEEDFQAIEELFVKAIILGQSEGSISNQTSPHILAHFLLVNLQGINVMARTKADRDRLEEVVTLTMDALD